MQRKEGMPSMVYWGLWGINSKPMAYVFVVLSLLLGIGFLGYGLQNTKYFFGVLFFLAAAWYYYCIRWVDKHADWDK